MPDPVETGRIRNRVTLQARSAPLLGAAGDDVPTWTTIGTYYAEVLPLTGRQLFNAQQVKATSDYSVRIRNTQPVAPLTHRFVYRGTVVLNPDSVNREDNRDEFYFCLCTFLRGQLP